MAVKGRVQLGSAQSEVKAGGRTETAAAPTVAPSSVTLLLPMGAQSQGTRALPPVGSATHSRRGWMPPN